MKRIIVLCLALSGGSCCSFAQSRRAVEDMAARHQTCLDEGRHMLQCSREYYRQMDSLLNMTYKNLYSGMAPAEREMLKKEQVSWLRRRDEYFKEQQAKYRKSFDAGEMGADMFMVVYDDDAEFVKERILELIDQRDKTAHR